MPTWTEIIIHHSVSPDTDGVDRNDIARWHLARHWIDIGYHFIVERVDDRYLAIMGRPLYLEGAHSPGHNRTAIGVCFVGDFSDHAPAHEQLICGARLIAGLCHAIGIPPGLIRAHRDVRATECPGKHFSVDHLRGLVETLLEEDK